MTEETDDLGLDVRPARRIGRWLLAASVSALAIGAALASWFLAHGRSISEGVFR